MLEPLKIEVVGALEVNGPPSEKDFESVTKIGMMLAEKIKAKS
jgi:hypothetical protein